MQFLHCEIGLLKFLFTKVLRGNKIRLRRVDKRAPCTLVDQAVCLYITCWTRGAVRLPAAKLAAHAALGFLNTKTMSLVVLLHAAALHHRLPLGLCLLEGAVLHATHRLRWVHHYGRDCKCEDSHGKLPFGYRHCGNQSIRPPDTLSIAQLPSKVLMGLTMHHSPTFYHQHRMAHLPTVYQHAHKLHHQMHGTTAFDATLYGWGMPEELIILPLELVVLAWAGLPPTLANLHAMAVGLGNKYGHVMLEGDAAIDNFHADHHVIHNKNFGIFHCLLDLYLGTCARREGYPLQVNIVPATNEMT